MGCFPFLLVLPSGFLVTDGNVPWRWSDIDEVENGELIEDELKNFK
jgi:hypothetical protein